MVSGEKRRDSAIHAHVSILPYMPLPSRLPPSLGQSSLCCTVGLCWLFILNIAVCTCPSQTFNISSGSLLSPQPPFSFSVSLTLALRRVYTLVLPVKLVLHTPSSPSKHRQPLGPLSPHAKPFTLRDGASFFLEITFLFL